MVKLLQSLSDFAIHIVEALGPESRLTVEGACGDSVVRLGTLFEWIILVAVMIYLFFGVRYYDYIRYTLLSVFGVKLIDGRGRYLNRGEQNNYLAVMVGIGLLLATIAATKAVATHYPDMLIDEVEQSSAYAVLAIAIAVFVVIIVGGYLLMLLAAGFVSEYQVLCQQLQRSKMQNMALAFTIAIPLLSLYLLASHIPVMPVAIGLFLIAIFAEIISIKDSFFCFKQQKVSILHWILYLCTLEIFPISLMLAPLLRESCGV